MVSKLPILAVAVLLNAGSYWLSQHPQKPDAAVSRIHAPEAREAKREEIPFAYDPEVFARVDVKTKRKAVAHDGVEGFPVEAPEHSCFYLQDKRPLPAFENGPRYFSPAYSFICFIPLEDPSVADFSKAYPYLREAAVKLRKVLGTRPRKFRDYKDIHDLPYNNAGQSVQSKVQYLDFKSGTGVLFLTQYTQEVFPNPLNNEELTCNFQGLTNDGKYYLAARLATTHASLPRGIDFTDHIERDDKYVYLKQGEKKLNGLAEESFRPSLLTLKALISSISLG